MKILRKNQVIIYTVALMLVTAGYLNYTSNMNNSIQETGALPEQQENMSVEEANLNENNLVSNQPIETEKNQESIEEKSLNQENMEEQNLNEENKDKQNEHEEQSTADNNEKVADIGDATLVSSNDIVTDYFAKSKLERDTMYSQMLETYEKILNSTNSLETQRQSATQEITKINNTKNSIMICENLIKNKGFDNCVVFVNDDSVSVVIGTENLKPEQVAQIQNIVSRELKVEIEKIHISIK